MLEGEVGLDGTNDKKLARNLPTVVKQMKMRYVIGFIVVNVLVHGLLHSGIAM
jgi:hypothetical protein